MFCSPLAGIAWPWRAENGGISDWSGRRGWVPDGKGEYLLEEVEGEVGPPTGALDSRRRGGGWGRLSGGRSCPGWTADELLAGDSVIPVGTGLLQEECGIRLPAGGNSFPSPRSPPPCVPFPYPECPSILLKGSG